MTMPITSSTPVGTTTTAPVGSHVHSFVDWPAILAGAAVASALSFVSISFGSAIGLTFTSPYSGSRSAIGVAIAIGLWTLWIAMSSVIAGAYVAGRLHRRHGQATQHEVEVRDGAHGLVVWALSALAGVWLATSALSGATDVAARAASSVTNGDPLSYAADSLLRRDDGGLSTAPNAGQARDQVKTMIAAGGVSGDMTPADRAYLTKLVAGQTGLAEPQAQARVDQMIATRKAAAEKARKSGVIAGFVAAVSLLLAAVAGWWAAALGGRHRDEETVFTGLGHWR